MNSSQTTSVLPWIVVGHSWGALLAIADLRARNQSVVWISDQGSKLLPLLPTVGEAASTYLQGLAKKLDCDWGEFDPNVSLKEFRGKGFQEFRTDRGGEVSEAELSLAKTSKGALSLGIGDILFEIQTKIDAWIVAGDVKVIEGIPIQGVECGSSVRVLLVGGEQIECQGWIYADFWEGLKGLEPRFEKISIQSGESLKLKDLQKTLRPWGIIQLQLEHLGGMSSKMSGLREGFCMNTTRDAGEEVDRRVWGYFFESGQKSVWSMILRSEECEDNHLVAKKLRKIKQALTKMFQPDLGDATQDFWKQVRSEKVLFEENYWVSRLKLPEAWILGGLWTLDGDERLRVMSEGFGAESLLNQIRAQGLEAESESVDVSSAENLSSVSESASRRQNVVDQEYI